MASEIKVANSKWWRETFDFPHDALMECVDDDGEIDVGALHDYVNDYFADYAYDLCWQIIEDEVEPDG